MKFFDAETIELNDQLKKIGYRLRPRVVERQPGHIAFDERGNAVYEWNQDRLGEDSEAGARARRKALENPTLSFVEEESQNDAPIQINPKGLRVGYNPYESGLLTRKAAGGGKRDLRQLSKWIEMKKRVENKRGE
ncbi:hypothetical protein [Steroidobacter sp.]|uniref:hypothetical protein n=1 Tax=Steroidobacter sp. TaxID=1978227 RepID=UPI001A4D03B6|nr:hypothetical protein [Steroidobacter sp.]MBL8264919.1 hypothetical protein [Steroidobacter sp.]